MNSKPNVPQDLDSQIEFLCVDAINLWRNKLGNMSKEYQFSRLERRLLIFIGRNPSIRQAELAHIMDLEPQSLTRALEIMERKTWLFKAEDAKDKRAKCLNLTELGRQKLKDALKISEKLRPLVLKNMSAEEKAALAKNLNLIKENLKNI